MALTGPIPEIPLTALFTKLPTSWLPSFDWYHSSGMEQCPLAVNGTCWQEQSLESILVGGRQSSGLVSSAVSPEWDW